MIKWILILTASYGPLGPTTTLHEFLTEPACVAVGEAWEAQTEGTRQAVWSCVAVEDAPEILNQIPVSIPGVGLVWFDHD